MENYPWLAAGRGQGEMCPLSPAAGMTTQGRGRCDWDPGLV